MTLTKEQAKQKFIGGKVMKGTVKLENGQVIEIEINEEQLAQMQVKKRTGYERVKEDNTYYYVKSYGQVDYFTENMENFDQKIYDTANYYSDKTVAENNARADKLFRQLRRFAVENRKTKLDWENYNQPKIRIVYDHMNKKLTKSQNEHIQYFGSIYFDTKEIAHKAIEKFHDELVWYFTAYKDSL